MLMEICVSGIITHSERSQDKDIHGVMQVYRRKVLSCIWRNFTEEVMPVKRSRNCPGGRRGQLKEPQVENVKDCVLGTANGSVWLVKYRGE